MEDETKPVENDPPVAEGAGPKELGHSYDGITEYDNPTPMWWNAIFVGTIFFAPVYALWFHSSQAENTHAANYQRALAANLRLQFGELGDLEPDEATLLTYMNDPKWKAVGASTFTTHCKQCHGNGEGISAPNLTDDYYLHVKEITDIAKVIDEGAKNGAMPAWGARLHPTELVLTAAYVASLRGQNLSSARPPEGNPIEPWPPAPAAPAATGDESEG